MMGGGAVENNTVNQLITITIVPPIHCQAVKNGVIAVNNVEEGILDSGASGHYGRYKTDP